MYTQRWHSVLLAGMVIVAALGIGASPVSAQSPHATLDRWTLTAGETFTVRVSGFNDDDELVTWVESARGTVYPTRGGATDDNGNATITIQTRTFWEPGWWVVAVKSWRGDRLASANFEVLAAPPSDALQVNPATVKAGERVYFYGDGFMPADTVSVWATRPDFTAFSLPSIVVDESRQIAFAFDVPVAAPPGEWSMTAYGRRSDRLLVARFTVER